MGGSWRRQLHHRYIDDKVWKDHFLTGWGMGMLTLDTRHNCTSYQQPPRQTKSIDFFFIFKIFGIFFLYLDYLKNYDHVEWKQIENPCYYFCCCVLCLQDLLTIIDLCVSFRPFIVIRITHRFSIQFLYQTFLIDGELTGIEIFIFLFYFQSFSWREY